MAMRVFRKETGTEYGEYTKEEVRKLFPQLYHRPSPLYQIILHCACMCDQGAMRARGYAYVVCHVHQSSEFHYGI